jgi:alcohol dehydrogenase class IV
VLVVSDRSVVASGITERVRERIHASGIESELFDDVHVEPTLESVTRAAEAAVEGGFDGFVGLGGGSSLDTAKIADLIATHGGEVMDYVNAPVGGGARPPAPLKPLLAMPTTPGSGSEATTVAIIDIPEQRVKSGISHRFLRPHQAIVDPEFTRTLPGAVVASTGLDVVCHAAESFVARPYDSRPRPESPADRPPYQGANPVSDTWSAKALELGGHYLRRAVADNEDLEARAAMMLAATMAGVGFGSAGVHIPHACAYPTASLKHEYRPPDYDVEDPFVPHGYSVIVFAPSAFRYTFEADPAKHRRAAELLGGEDLSEALVELMRDVGAPRGLVEFGYGEDDVDALVEGALKQRRLLDVAPREVGPSELAEIIRGAHENWPGRG